MDKIQIMDALMGIGIDPIALLRGKGLGHEAWGKLHMAKYYGIDPTQKAVGMLGLHGLNSCFILKRRVRKLKELNLIPDLNFPNSMMDDRGVVEFFDDLGFLLEFHHVSSKKALWFRGEVRFFATIRRKVAA